MSCLVLLKVISQHCRGTLWHHRVLLKFQNIPGILSDTLMSFPGTHGIISEHQDTANILQLFSPFPFPSGQLSDGREASSGAERSPTPTEGMTAQVLFFLECYVMLSSSCNILFSPPTDHPSINKKMTLEAGNLPPPTGKWSQAYDFISYVSTRELSRPFQLLAVILRLCSCNFTLYWPLCSR